MKNLFTFLIVLFSPIFIVAQWTTYDIPEGRTFLSGATLINSTSLFLSTMLVFDDVTTPTYDLYHATASLHLYPTPASDQLFIEKKEDQPVQLSIVDAFGKVLLQKTATDATTAWDISSLLKGIYFLIGKSTEGDIIHPSEKIVKQ